NFFKKMKPLSNLEDIKENSQKIFLQQCENEKFPGWKKQIGSDEDNGLFCAGRKDYLKKPIKAANTMTEKHKRNYLEVAKERDNREKEIVYGIEAEEVNDIESESEDENKIYNPLKLLLGWDGKPIPYLLYKLHGLGVEYPCEICLQGQKSF
ncbi:22437_t:CDS:2, partial [Racocetra persica]